MNIEFSFDFAGPIKMLADMIEAAQKPKEVLDGPVADVFRADFDRQFSLGGVPDKWQELTPETIANKRYAGYPRRNRKGEPTKMGTQNGRFGPENILIRQGDLRVSWTKKDGPDHICTVEGSTLTIGSARPYAIYHQSTEPRKEIPRRPLVVTSEAMALSAVRVSEYLLGVKR